MEQNVKMKITTNLELAQDVEPSPERERLFERLRAANERIKQAVISGNYRKTKKGSK